MIEKLIECSIRNRFLVMIVGGGAGRSGPSTPSLNTPVDAIPDLSENQVIVFTDWMGRSPQEIEDQITYPLSLNLQGLAGVKVVRSSSEFNFSMITIIFEDNIDFYFARQRVLEKLPTPSTFLPQGVAPVPGPRRHGPRPDLLVHRRRAATSTPASCGRFQDWYVRPQLNSVPGVAEVASVGGMPLRVPDRPRPERAPRLRHHPGRALRRRRPHQLGRRRPGHPEGERRVPDPLRRLDREHPRHREHRRHASAAGTPIYVRNVATVQVGPQFRRSVLEKDGNEVVGGVVADALRREPAGGHRAHQGEDSRAPSRPARGRADRPLLRPHAADPRGHRHADRGHVARDDHRRRRHPAHPDARPQRLRHLRHAAAGGAVHLPDDVAASRSCTSSTSRPTS